MIKEKEIANEEERLNNTSDSTDGTINEQDKKSTSKGFSFESRFWPGNWRKKEKELLFKLGAVLVVGLIFMNVVSHDTRNKKPSVNAGSIVSQDSEYRNSEAMLERRLEEVLARIKGAETVSVAVTFEYGAESEYALDRETTDSTTIEASAGTSESDRKSIDSQEKTSLAQQNGEPVLVKEYMPKIKGVLVVSKGAGDSKVRSQLFNAVQGLLGVSAHRINIVEGN
ncbi:MAG: hypothetical protein ACOX7H_01370 [Bacillota bacterium]|jgi:stage III sporulation protein AG